MKPAALFRDLLLKHGVGEERKTMRRHYGTRDFPVGLASPGALFARLKTFDIKAAETRDSEERNHTICLCFERRNTAKHHLLCSADNIVLCDRVYGSASPLYRPIL